MARRVVPMTTLAALGLALATAGCGSSSSSTEASSSGGGGGGAQTSLTIKGFAFSPSPVTVAPGTVTLAVANQDGAEHSVTFDDNSQSVDVEAGKSATLTFTAPSSGTIAYHCKYHASMHGTISVGGAAGAGGGGSTSSSAGPYG